MSYQKKLFIVAEAGLYKLYKSFYSLLLVRTVSDNSDVCTAYDTE